METITKVNERHLLTLIERYYEKFIYSTAFAKSVWRIRYNRIIRNRICYNELKKLFKDVEIIKDLKLTMLRWVGHLMGMMEHGISKKVSDKLNGWERKVGLAKAAAFGLKDYCIGVGCSTKNMITVSA